MIKAAVIGDVHSCWRELECLLRKIESKGYEPLFVGDFFDRGPGTIEVAKYLLEEKPMAVMGNHCNKLWRFLKGNNVKPKHGLQRTLDDLSKLYGVEPSELPRVATDLRDYLGKLPPFIYLQGNDGRALVVVHAAISPEILQEYDSYAFDQFNNASRRKVKKFDSICYYGVTTGKKDSDGFPIRKDFSHYWSSLDYSNYTVVHGHVVTADHKPRIYGDHSNVIDVDTGCVFGGRLTAYLWNSEFDREHQFLSVDSNFNVYKEEA